jgi:hypothetical protein
MRLLLKACWLAPGHRWRHHAILRSRRGSMGSLVHGSLKRRRGHTSTERRRRTAEEHRSWCTCGHIEKLDIRLRGCGWRHRGPPWSILRRLHGGRRHTHAIRRTHGGQLHRVPYVKRTNVMEIEKENVMPTYRTIWRTHHLRRSILLTA